MYTAYCAKYDGALKRLAAARKDEGWRPFKLAE